VPKIYICVKQKGTSKEHLRQQGRKLLKRIMQLKIFTK